MRRSERRRARLSHREDRLVEGIGRRRYHARCTTVLSGKAQTLAAIAVQPTAAEAALREVRDNFGRLPTHIIRDTDSWFGWSEYDLRFVESYVHSHLGDSTRAEQAYTAALSLHPPTINVVRS